MFTVSGCNTHLCSSAYACCACWLEAQGLNCFEPTLLLRILHVGPIAGRHSLQQNGRKKTGSGRLLLTGTTPQAPGPGTPRQAPLCLVQATNFELGQSDLAGKHPRITVHTACMLRKRCTDLPLFAPH